MKSVTNPASAPSAARLAVRDLDARTAICAALALAIVAILIRIALIW